MKEVIKKTYSKEIECQRCNGTGVEYEGEFISDCMICNGRGMIVITTTRKQKGEENVESIEAK